MISMVYPNKFIPKILEADEIEVVKKGWGKEIIFANNDKYCGKLLVYTNDGAISSFHMHPIKDETFFVFDDGIFEIHWVNPQTADKQYKLITKGMSVRIPPKTLHQIKCLKAGTILEVSTPHDDEDVIRVEHGDSQRLKSI